MPEASRQYSILHRFSRGDSRLLEVYRNTVDAIGEGRAVTPASEWLVDNYHLVERHIREIHRICRRDITGSCRS
jgi:cyclic beta-1,2-glucan synthetase